MSFEITQVCFRHCGHTDHPVAGAPAWPGVATPGTVGHPGAAPPPGFGHQLRRWAALLALAGMALPGTATARTAAPPPEATSEPAPASLSPAEHPLPLGDPWEAVVVEPALEPPASPGPWPAAEVEPDGMPLPAAPVETARGGAGPAPDPGPVPPERQYLRRILVRYAQENGLPADLVMALAWRESSWRARAVSSAGAVGVLQLMPDTVAFTSKTLLGLKRPLDPRDATGNIRMGTRFLRWLVDVYGGDYRRALIAYNQGATALAIRGSFGESEDFADSVIALRPQFRRP
jgi:soluble lytic murein transglycosylase-like protein